MNKSSFLFFSLLKKFFQCSIIIYFLILSSLAYGDNHIIKSHGISTFGELKYNSDFQHLDYVNPNAPKGGEVSIWAFGSFDSMHPYTTKGGQAVFHQSFLKAF